MSGADTDKTIAALARENVAMREQIADLKDSESRRNSWLYRAKIDAGYDDNVSFDVVWAEALAALLEKRKSRIAD